MTQIEKTKWRQTEIGECGLKLKNVKDCQQPETRKESPIAYRESLDFGFLSSRNVRITLLFQATQFMRMYYDNLGNLKDWSSRKDKIQIIITWNEKRNIIIWPFDIEDNNKSMLWTTLCQQIQQLRWNGQIYPRYLWKYTLS